MKKSISDTIICIGIYIILIVFAIQLPNTPEDARGYPMFMLVVSSIITSILFVSSIRLIKEEQEPELQGRNKFLEVVKSILLYCIFMGSYIFLIEKISYIAATLLFVFVSLKYLKVKSIPTLILLPIGMTFAIYFIFTKILMVSLPIGTWFYIVL